MFPRTAFSFQDKVALSTGGVLAFKAAKDFEAPDDANEDGDYEVTVRVTDGANATQAERIRRLEHIIGELNRVIYGKRSEKLTPDERQLAFEDLMAAAAELEEAVKPVSPPKPAPSPKRPAAARNIGRLPEVSNGGAKLVHPGGAKLVHLNVMRYAVLGGCPGSP